MGVNFREIGDTNKGARKFNIGGIPQDELVGTFRGSILQGIDTSLDPVKVEGIDYYPGKTHLRGIRFGEKTIHPEQDGLFSKDAQLLYIGQIPQVRRGETRTDGFLGPMTPIFSNERFLGRDINDVTNDMQNAHWINQEEQPTYVNGSAMEGEYQIYKDTALGEVMRINVSKLYSIFANITPEGKVVYLNNTDVDLIGKLQNSVYGEVSLLLPRGLGVGSLVDKELNIVRDGVSNIATLQDPKLGPITQMPYSKGVNRNLTLNVNQEEVDYPESLTKNIVKTSEGIFTNTTNGVLNSSGELLIIGDKKVTKISYGYDMPQDSYMVQLEGDEGMIMIKGNVLKGKDLY